MALPTSRTTTYAALSQVLSADLNTIQDCIVGWKHNDVVEDVGMDMLSGAGPQWTPGSTAAGERYLFPNTAGADMVLRLPLRVGDRIKQVDVYLLDNDAGNNIDCKVWKQLLTSGSAPGTPAQLGSTQSTSGNSGNIQKKTITITPEVTVADTVYSVEIKTNGATTNVHRVYGAKVTYDRI